MYIKLLQTIKSLKTYIKLRGHECCARANMGLTSQCSVMVSGADPEIFHRGDPTLSKENPITHTRILVILLLFCGLILFDV